MLIVHVLALYEPLPFAKFQHLAERFLATTYPAKPLFPPIAFYGDFHGFAASIVSARANRMQKILLGDYVDRGAHGVFVLQTALQMQVAGGAYLLRGNHEDLDVNAKYNFIEQLQSAYPNDFEAAKELVRRVYKHMPIMMLINSAFGTIAAVHGGVSFQQGVLEIYDFAPTAESIEDILWSDPGSEYTLNPRGAGLVYDRTHFTDWSSRNGVAAVVRGHQVVQTGVRDDFNDRRHWTVFSATGYDKDVTGGWLLLDDETGFTEMRL